VDLLQKPYVYAVVESIRYLSHVQGGETLGAGARAGV